MKWPNVIGLLVGTSLLMACADGRGTNGFKSYQYSKDELARNKSLKAGSVSSKSDRTNSGSDDSSKTAELPPPSIPPKDQGQVLLRPSEDGDKGSATAKVISSTDGAENPSQVAPMTGSVKDINVSILGELAKGDNESAKNLIKGITILPEGSSDKRTITLQAVVVVGGEEVHMDAANIPVSYLRDDQELSQMLFTLMKPCDQTPVVVRNALSAAAKCQDEACNKIELILSFEVAGGNRANGIVIVELGKGAEGKLEWRITASNIGRPKSFVQAQAEGKACPIPEQKQSDQGNRAESGGTVTPLSRSITIPNASSGDHVQSETNSVPDLDCKKTDAQGFSVCDSPVERVRMRSKMSAPTQTVEGEESL